MLQRVKSWLCRTSMGAPWLHRLIREIRKSWRKSIFSPSTLKGLLMTKSWFHRIVSRRWREDNFTSYLTPSETCRGKKNNPDQRKTWNVICRLILLSEQGGVVCVWDGIELLEIQWSRKKNPTAGAVIVFIDWQAVGFSRTITGRQILGDGALHKRNNGSQPKDVHLWQWDSAWWTS